MLEECTTIGSCESLLLNQVRDIGLLGQIPLTDKDFNKICAFISDEFPYSRRNTFERDITHYPATISCYLVWKGIFNYIEGSYWNSIDEEIKFNNPSRNAMLGKLFLEFIERHNLYNVEIPRSKKYLTPILMHGIIPQEQVQEYFEKIIYPLVTKELICPTDKIELSYWLEENRNLEIEEENANLISENLEKLTNATEIIKPIDLEILDNNIEILNQKIVQLSDELNSLNEPEVQKADIPDIKNDIQTVEKLKQDLILLGKKKEIISNHIQNKINPIDSTFSEDIIYVDYIKSYAGNALVEYLQNVAETVNLEEKDDLLKFLISFSAAVNENRIQLPDEIMKKYDELVSQCIVRFSDDENDEIFDITAAHVYGNADIKQPDSHLPLFPSSQSDYNENNGYLAFLKIDSLYNIENFPSFFKFDAETEMGEYLLAHIFANQNYGDNSNYREDSAKKYLTSDLVRIFDSLALYQQEEEPSINSFETEFKLVDTQKSQIPAVPCIGEAINQVFAPEIKKIQSNQGICNDNSSLCDIKNEELSDPLPSELSKNPMELPKPEIDLSKIVESILVQKINNQKNILVKENIVENPILSGHQSLTPENITKVCNGFIEKKSHQITFSENVIHTDSLKKSPHNTKSTEFPVNKNKIYSFTPFKEQNYSIKIDPIIPRTKKEPVQQDKTHFNIYEDVKINPESDKKILGSIDTKESLIEDDIFEINPLKTSVNNDQKNTINDSEVYIIHNNALNKPPQKIDYISSSLADDSKIKVKSKKKFSIIKLITRLFKKIK